MAIKLRSTELKVLINEVWYQIQEQLKAPQQANSERGKDMGMISKQGS